MSRGLSLKPITRYAPSTACRATRSNTPRCALCSESISIGGIANAAAEDNAEEADDNEEAVDVKGDADEEEDEVAHRWRVRASWRRRCSASSARQRTVPSAQHIHCSAVH